jgi:hypothetical protein
MRAPANQRRVESLLPQEIWWSDRAKPRQLTLTHSLTLTIVT